MSFSAAKAPFSGNGMCRNSGVRGRQAAIVTPDSGAWSPVASVLVSILHIVLFPSVNVLQQSKFVFYYKLLRPQALSKSIFCQ